MSRARWDDTITWMVEQQNMPEPSEAERKVLLDYLASRFGESRGRGDCVDTRWGDAVRKRPPTAALNRPLISPTNLAP